MNLKEDKPTSQELKRFFDRIDKQPGEDGCWLWTGALNSKSGHGYIRYRNTALLVHRFSYMYHTGENIDDYTITRICGMRHCVNPHHMVLKRNPEVIKARREIRKKFCDRGHLRRPETLNSRGHCLVCIKHRRERLKRREAYLRK